MWHQTPRDAGQMVERHWHAVGQDGAILRVVDRSEGSNAVPVYRLHRWLSDGIYEPWNGRLGVWTRGRRITSEEVARLLEEVS